MRLTSPLPDPSLDATGASLDRLSTPRRRALRFGVRPLTPAHRRDGARRRPWHRSAPESTPHFAPIAPVTGSLNIRVVYPPDGATIAARDSTFIFGSVGSWRRPPDDQRRRCPGASQRSVARLAPAPAARDRRLVDRGDARCRHRAVGATDDLPGGAHRAPGDRSAARRFVVRSVHSRERDGSVRISCACRCAPRRMPRCAGVRPTGSTHPLRNGDGARPPGRRRDALGDAGAGARDAAGGACRGRAGTRHARRWRRPPSLLLDASGPRYGVVGERPPAATPFAPDSDRVVIARPVPSGGTYKWFLLPGTVVEITGRAGGDDAPSPRRRARGVGRRRATSASSPRGRPLRCASRGTRGWSRTVSGATW